MEELIKLILRTQNLKPSYLTSLIFLHPDLKPYGLGGCCRKTSKKPALRKGVKT